MNGKSVLTEETVVYMASPEEWVALAEPIQRQLVEGQRYVFYDGAVLPAVLSKTFDCRPPTAESNGAKHPFASTSPTALPV